MDSLRVVFCSWLVYTDIMRPDYILNGSFMDAFVRRDMALQRFYTMNKKQLENLDIFSL